VVIVFLKSAGVRLTAPIPPTPNCIFGSQTTPFHINTLERTNVGPVLNSTPAFNALDRSLRSRNRRHWPLRNKNAEVDQPCGGIELGVQGMNAVVVRVPFLGWNRVDNGCANDRLHKYRQLTCAWHAGLNKEKTYDCGSFGGLAKTRADSLPPHGDRSVAVVPESRESEHLILLRMHVEIHTRLSESRMGSAFVYRGLA